MYSDRVPGALGRGVPLARVQWAHARRRQGLRHLWACPDPSMESRTACSCTTGRGTAGRRSGEFAVPTPLLLRSCSPCELALHMFNLVDAHVRRAGHNLCSPTRGHNLQGQSRRGHPAQGRARAPCSPGTRTTPIALFFSAPGHLGTSRTGAVAPGLAVAPASAHCGEAPRRPPTAWDCLRDQTSP